MLADDRAGPAVPFILAGQPISSWAFAARTWIAMMIALYAAFWLQLDPAYDSALTVAILAEPLRGQALQKGLYRFLATIVGSIASIVIAGVFAQVRDLYVFACAAWMAVCVFLSSYYDGFRAYGVVLAGYTVALVAMSDIDTPQHIFSLCFARGASICCGIVAIAIVNDVFNAPNVYPDVRRRLFDVHAQTSALVIEMVLEADPAPEAVFQLIDEIVRIRTDIEILPSEGSTGTRRASAARSASIAMIRSIMAAHGFMTLSRIVAFADAKAVRDALTEEPSARLAVLQADLAAGATPERTMLVRCAADIVEEQALAADELRVMDIGGSSARRVTLLLHRDWQGALRLAIRVFLVIAAAGFLIALCNWPAMSGAWRYTGLLGGLAALRPNARAFANVGIITTLIMTAVVGVTEFLVLDGTDSFPLLAIGLAPAVFTFSFLSLSKNPKLHGIGALGLVFLILIYEPSNPPTYSPQVYLYNSFYAISAAVLFFGLLRVFMPTTDRERRRWLVGTSWSEFEAAVVGNLHRGTDAMTFLTAHRIVQLEHMSIGSLAARRRRLKSSILLFNLTTFALRAHAALHALRRAGAQAEPIQRAAAALARLDPVDLRRSSDELNALLAPDALTSPRTEAIASLQFVATRADADRSTLRHFRRSFAG